MRRSNQTGDRTRCQGGTSHERRPPGRCGLPPPPDLDGTELTPLWEAPSSPLKDVAFSEYPRRPPSRPACVLGARAPPPPPRTSSLRRCAPADAAWQDTTSCIKTKRQQFTFMGYSVRTDTHRATFWMHWDGGALAGNFSAPPAAIELYSHEGDGEADFDAFENENVADAQPELVAQLLARAKTQWAK